MNADADPLWLTLHAGQPPPMPVGPVTNDWPRRSVRMLGSATPPLPDSRRFVLKVDAGGAAAPAGTPPPKHTSTAISAPARAAVRLWTYRRIRTLRRLICR